MSTSQLELLPEPLQVESAFATFVQDAFHMVEPDVPVFSSIQGTSEPIQVFIAHTPDIALKWICERVSKQLMMRLVEDFYEGLQSEDRSNDGDKNNESTPGKPHTKRSRGGGRNRSNRVNKRLKEQLDFALVETIASTQDLENARKNNITLSSKELRYRAFAKGLGNVGINEVAEMINRAKAVASFNCVQDWCTVLETWRELHQDGRKLFAGDGPRLLPSRDRDQNGGSEDIDMDETSSQMQLSQQAGGRNLVGALTQKEIHGFRNLLASVRRSETVGILGDMRHRWVLATLYTEYLRLEENVRKRTGFTSTRGRGIATLAREELFAAVDSQDRVPMSGEEKAARCKNWGRYLDYGKRWSMLGERFGMGVFALLPRGGVPNSFIERRAIPRLVEWMDMLLECNDRVVDLSLAIEPLLVCCMREDEPPPQLVLESVDERRFEACTSTDLLLPLADTQRDFENVSESDESIVEDSQSF